MYKERNKTTVLRMYDDCYMDKRVPCFHKAFHNRDRLQLCLERAQTKPLTIYKERPLVSSKKKRKNKGQAVKNVWFIGGRSICQKKTKQKNRPTKVDKDFFC